MAQLERSNCAATLILLAAEDDKFRGAIYSSVRVKLELNVFVCGLSNLPLTIDANEPSGNNNVDDMWRCIIRRAYSVFEQSCQLLREISKSRLAFVRACRDDDAFS